MRACLPFVHHHPATYQQEQKEQPKEQLTPFCPQTEERRIPPHGRRNVAAAKVWVRAHSRCRARRRRRARCPLLGWAKGGANGPHTRKWRSYPHTVRKQMMPLRSQNPWGGTGGKEGAHDTRREKAEGWQRMEGTRVPCSTDRRGAEREEEEEWARHFELGASKAIIRKRGKE